MAQGKRHRGESDKDYAARLRDGGKLGSTAKTGESLCMNPELSEPDPNFRTVQGSDIAVEGIDLDGTDSAAADVSDGASCPHDNFSGIDGQSGIDNQRSEEHTSELPSLMRISYAVFCVTKNNTTKHKT